LRLVLPSLPPKRPCCRVEDEAEGVVGGGQGEDFQLFGGLQFGVERCKSDWDGQGSAVGEFDDSVSPDVEKEPPANLSQLAILIKRLIKVAPVNQPRRRLPLKLILEAGAHRVFPRCSIYSNAVKA
jgi:hypothetical protein